MSFDEEPVGCPDCKGPLFPYCHACDDVAAALRAENARLTSEVELLKRAAQTLVDTVRGDDPAKGLVVHHDIGWYPDLDRAIDEMETALDAAGGPIEPPREGGGA